ncbi:hypothetical protein [Methanobacterium sp. SMA-27]|uniref:hypothetical protein n=1 Tax=Methanobacterium sp. SMA-27 TaxID=1495336 RepID=UPI00064FB701|nr:hypothetical protein [Methanobacterium sp. SMA-27]
MHQGYLLFVCINHSESPIKIIATATLVFIVEKPVPGLLRIEISKTQPKKTITPANSIKILDNSEKNLNLSIKSDSSTITSTNP